jgi:hypothetical protein
MKGARLRLERRDDWPERLAAEMEAQAGRPFAWGAHDCTTAFSDTCLAMTGTDPMAEFRGRYDSDASSARVLKEIGGGSLYHTMTAKFGKPVPPALLRRGDAALSADGALLTVLGEQAVGPGLDGEVRVKTLACRFGWRV